MSRVEVSRLLAAIRVISKCQQFGLQATENGKNQDLLVNFVTMDNSAAEQLPDLVRQTRMRRGGKTG